MKRYPLIQAAAPQLPEFGTPTVQATFVIGAEGELKVPRVDIVAYTGVPMVVPGFKRPVLIDLQGVFSTRATLPLLKDHRPDLVIGHADRIDNDGRTLRVSGVMSGNGPSAREVVENAKQGFPWQSSVTAIPTELEEIPAGRSVVVNGREWVGPLTVARRAKLKEISLLSMGADDQTSAAIAAAMHSKEAPNMTFEQWLQARGMSISDLTPGVEQELRASYQAEQDEIQAGNAEGGEAGGEGGTATRKPKAKKPAKAPATGGKPGKAIRAAAGQATGGKPGKKTWIEEQLPDGDNADDIQAGDNADDGEGDNADDIQAGDDQGADIAGQVRPVVAGQIAAERRRIAGIRRRCGDHPIVNRAIEAGLSPDQAELEMYRQGGGNRNAARRSAQPNDALVIEAALCRSAGMGDSFVEGEYDERVLEAADRFRGIGIQGLMRMVAIRAGMHIGPESFGDAAIRTAFAADAAIIAADGGGFSTMSLTGILGNVLHKQMLASYRAVPSVLEKFCRFSSVSDFKRHNRYRLTGKGEFKRVTEDGELKHVSLQDASFGVQADTYGAIIGLDRKKIINDDLGAFLEIPRILGRMGALHLQELVFTELMDNSDNFFHDDNGNYLEGADTALSIPALSLAEALFLNQTDDNGKPIMLMPKTLLHPTSLKVTAEQLYNDRFVTQFNDDGVARPNSNPHAGKFEPVTTPYLNSGAMANSSEVAYYLFGDPNDVAAIEVAFLRGQREPVVEPIDTPGNVLGRHWRAYHDVGVEKQDPRGAVLVLGEAE